ncbi:MAG: cytochrome c biogenesis heme-transporting ATPase CcmA [Gammaproteobacteria bacterium]|nr:cytochrome c biogenesis heme-transporting ATPase CcmA [Gammaproteobacteria bacterium]MDH5614441.1 cytochrome c biogenesis heme-transporting ATPase CcmA [Gammaproteobacteria bacterium]
MQSSTNHHLEIINLACTRQDRRLFSGLNFTMTNSDILQIEGPNGSGKTSLLRMLCGLLLPEEGEIHWQGKDISRDRAPFLEDLIYIGHRPGIKDELTPRENLNHICNLHGSKPDTDIDQALKNVGLYGFEDVPVRTLSAGQKRRVALSRLLFSTARFWILDEPFTALDKAGQSYIEKLLEQHSQNGGLIMITTHQPLHLENCNVKSVQLGNA